MQAPRAEPLRQPHPSSACNTPCSPHRLVIPLPKCCSLRGLWKARLLPTEAKSKEREAKEKYRKADRALKKHCRDFPRGPVAKTLHSQCRGPSFDS